MLFLSTTTIIDNLLGTGNIISICVLKLCGFVWLLSPLLFRVYGV